MARKLRNRTSDSRSVTAQPRNVAGLTYAGSQLRAHCPLCGMMANTERFSDAPFEVDTQMQYYGGSIRQHYESAPEYTEKVMRLILSQLDEVRDYLLEELGESPRSVRPAPEIEEDPEDVDDDGGLDQLLDEDEESF